MRIKEEIIEDLMFAMNQPVVDWIVDLVRQGDLNEAMRIMEVDEHISTEDAQVLIDDILDHLFNINV
jgi:hypothetical protein